jgi:hypothetical protein
MRVGPLLTTLPEVLALCCSRTRTGRLIEGNSIVEMGGQDLRSWRKMTWAVAIWTVLFAIWGITGASAVSDNCAGQTGDALATCQAATAIGGGIGLTFIFMLWFIGFIILSLIWFMSRSKHSVVVYGPSGQQVSVSEKEATSRVKKGWTYQPQAPMSAPPTKPPAA